jgi:hypothetical protein
VMVVVGVGGKVEVVPDSHGNTTHGCLRLTSAKPCDYRLPTTYDTFILGYYFTLLSRLLPF